MKKKILLILSILVFFLIGFFVYKKFFEKKNIKEETISPNPPEITNYFGNSLPITLNVGKKEVDIPKSLPVLQKESQTNLMETEYLNIANALGFSEDPKTIQGKIFGKSLIWNSSTNFLIIYIDEKKIKYGPSVNPIEIISGIIDKKITEPQYVSLAQDFLKNKININPDEIKYLNSTYLRQEEGKEILDITTSDKSQVIQINFSFSKADYPIFSAGGIDPDVYVQLLKDGTVLNSEIVFTNTFKKSELEYPLKSYDELAGSLDKAIIVSLDNGNINLPDLNVKDIVSISIENISIVYYLNSVNDQSLQPVFLLKGTSNIKKYAGNINISLYLPAFK